MNDKFKMYMSPEGDGVNGAGAGGPPPDSQQQPPQTPPNSGDPQRSQYVPYDRFQEVNSGYNDLKQKYSELQKTIEELTSKNRPDPDQEFQSNFYKDPARVVREFVASEITKLKEEGSKRDTEARRQSAIGWFRSQEGYTPEMEEKATRFIVENGLNGVDPEKAVKLAHKFLTMGDGSGYVRTVKENLGKPGPGGKAPVKTALDELRDLDPRDPDYEEKAKAIHAKITAGK